MVISRETGRYISSGSIVGTGHCDSRNVRETFGELFDEVPLVRGSGSISAPKRVHRVLLEGSMGDRGGEMLPQRLAAAVIDDGRIVRAVPVWLIPLRPSADVNAAEAAEVESTP